MKIFSIAEWLANARLRMANSAMHLPTNRQSRKFQFICPYLSLVNWAVISLYSRI